MNQRQDQYENIIDDICLSARNITKIYPGIIALNKVDFNIYRGKVNALIGENGAGKSTLMKIIAGIEQPDQGIIYLNGLEIRMTNPREAAAKGIGIIHQELSLFPNLTVTQNIFMARECVRYGITLDHRRHLEETRRVMRWLGQNIEPDAKVGDLRVGQQQIVEIARTIIQHNLHVLIMDEPTSSLSAPEVEVLFKVIRELQEQGVSIIYISHRLEEVMRIADYVTILRDGDKVAEARVCDIDIPWIVKHMVGRETLTIEKTHQVHEDKELLRVESLTLPRVGGGYALDHVSFTLRRGEILGVYGLLGAGRTELIETLMGLHPEAKGRIYITGKKRKIGAVWDQIGSGLAHVPEDRQREGLIPILSIEKNLTLSSLRKYAIKGFHINSHSLAETVRRMVNTLEIKLVDKNLPVTSLSGGNQQKVVLGKGILTSPKILLLDEPTRGIDVAAKADVFQLMDRLAAEGLGIIFVATELKEILTISDRVIVMSNGRLTGEFKGMEMTEEALVTASFIGHDINEINEQRSISR